MRRHEVVPSHKVAIFLGQEVYYYMVYNTYHTELNLQICNYAQKRRICRENSKNGPAKIFVGILAFPERLSNSATLVYDSISLEPVFGLIYEI